ncbi:DUF5960 family protein [Enterococcus florum]|nr:DUF5960 family protein [Enterococcus florum]
MISSDTFEFFYKTYFSLVQEPAALPLFLSEIVQKMDDEGRDYFKVSAKRTGRNKDIYFQFKRVNDELVFTGIHTRGDSDGNTQRNHSANQISQT